jgi:excisionase family DNA binding protein
MSIVSREQASSPTAPPPDRFAYRISDACVALGIGRTSLYELVKSGELRLIKLAGRTLVPRSELERLTRIDDAAQQND